MQIVVAKDGSGDYHSIQEAVHSIPDNGKDRVTIYIKNGVYKEKLHIENSNIHLIGEDVKMTIVTFDDYACKSFPDGQLYHTFHSYSVFIGADDFHAENITFENSAGKGDQVGQAVAVYADGDRLTFVNCRFIGHQDTLFTGPLPPDPKERPTFGGPREGMPRRHGRHYYERCYIQGDVDFIFGSATAVFHLCEIFSVNRLGDRQSLHQDQNVNGWITAASTPRNARYGYVFIDCKLTGDAPRHSVYLGRPWRLYAKTAYIRCWMGDVIHPEGWHNWGKAESEHTTEYCEYGSTGPGGEMSRRVPWSKILTSDEAEQYAAHLVLAGEDGWNPYKERELR
jgi:pectinesterase